MKICNINGTNYLAKELNSEGILVRAMQINSDSIDQDEVISYFQKSELTSLKNITFSNAIYTERDLDSLEIGIFNLVQAAMTQARTTALATVTNARLLELLGK